MKVNVRRLVSLTTTWSFILVLTTGIVLFFVPHGRVAYWSDWGCMGLSKTQWGNLHVTSSALFCIAALWHTALNIKQIQHYIRRKVGDAVRPSYEVVISLVVTLLLCVGTFYDWPPFGSLVGLGEKIKDAGSERYGEPPYGHAELSSLRVLATRMQLDLDQSINTLRANGIHFEDASATIEEIARENETTPRVLYDMIVKAQKQTGSDRTGSLPVAPLPGLGRKTLKEIADMFSADGRVMRQALEKEGVEVDPDKPLKELADQAGKTPMKLYEVIQQAVSGAENE